RLPRVNLFIADDTGLGKTIEAGLIARELLLRRKAKAIVVAAPPSVLEQWKAELEERFGLVFEILDRAYVARVRRERGFGVNPWRTHSRFLVSHHLLIDPAYADPLREWLGPLLPASLLILDEAHAGDPRPRRPLRAPALPLRDAAQRPLEQLLDPLGAARPVPLHPRRPGPEAGARGRHGAAPQGGHPHRPRRLPETRRRPRRHRRAPRGGARAGAVAPPRRVPNGARGALRGELAARAGRRRAPRRRPPAAAPLVGRGLRAEPRGAPKDRREAVGRADARARAR